MEQEIFLRRLTVEGYMEQLKIELANSETFQEIVFTTGEDSSRLLLTFPGELEEEIAEAQERILVKLSKVK